MNFLEIVGLLTLIVLGVLGTVMVLGMSILYWRFRKIRLQMADSIERLRRARQQAENDGYGDRTEPSDDVVEGTIVRPNPVRKTLDYDSDKLPPIDRAMAMDELRARGHDVEDVAFLRPFDNAVDLFDAVCGLVPDEEHDELADLLHQSQAEGAAYKLFIAWNENRPAEERLRRVAGLSNCEAWVR
jgi:hypothetical protein